MPEMMPSIFGQTSPTNSSLPNLGEHGGFSYLPHQLGDPIWPPPANDGVDTDLVLDSTGLKIFGQGEWCRAKHGRKPRGWKKFHIGLDAKSGMIVSHLMTGKDAGDPDQIDDILDQIDHPIYCFMADGAYDGEPVYDAVKRHSSDPAPKVVIPPRKTAVLSSEDEEDQTERDRHILELEAQGPDGMAKGP